MRGRSTWVAGLALPCLLFVAACDPGTEDPTPAPPTSESPTDDPTTSESPSDEVPTPPEVEAPTPAPEASVDDHVGAIYAARYFLDLYTYMRATGDTSQFEAMSADGCEFCAGAVENAEEITADGGWAEGGELEFDIEKATAEYPTDDEPNYLVRFAMTQAPQQIHRADGSTDAVEATSGDVVVALQYTNGRFITHGVNFEED